jgi:hypothetical protein
MSNTFQVLSATYDSSFPLSASPDGNDPLVTLSFTVNGEQLCLGNVFFWSAIQRAYAAEGASGVQLLFMPSMVIAYNRYLSTQNQPPITVPDSPTFPVATNIPLPVTGTLGTAVCTQGLCGSWTD